MRDYCLFVVGINCWLRISDLLSLEVGDVLDDRGKVKDSIRIEIREKKTKKVRNFPLNDSARKAIQEYLSTRQNLRPEDPLFVSRKRNKNGELCAIKRNMAYKAIRKATEDVGIQERIGTHSMRKTGAYQAIVKGFDKKKVQKILNHSSERHLNDYIGITQDEADELLLDLNL